MKGPRGICARAPVANKDVHAAAATTQSAGTQWQFTGRKLGNCARARERGETGASLFAPWRERARHSRHSRGVERNGETRVRRRKRETVNGNYVQENAQFVLLLLRCGGFMRDSY